MTESGLDFAYGRFTNLQEIVRSGYTFISRYVSTPGNGKNIDAVEAQSYRAAGLHLVLFFETTANRALDGYGAGVADAQSADQQGRAVGYSDELYFAVDFDAQPSQFATIGSYFDGIRSVLGNRTGGYGSYGVLKWLFDNGKIVHGFQTEAWSHGNLEPRVSYLQKAQTINVQGVWCDANVGFGNIGVTDMEWTTPMPGNDWAGNPQDLKSVANHLDQRSSHMDEAWFGSGTEKAHDALGTATNLESVLLDMAGWTEAVPQIWTAIQQLQKDVADLKVSTGQVTVTPEMIQAGFVGALKQAFGGTTA